MFIKNIIKKIYLKRLDSYQMANYMKGKLYHVGDDCQFFITDFGTEPYLISIHNKVLIASGVRFITHDASCHWAERYLREQNRNGKERLDRVGSVEIFDNCFIGMNSLIMQDVKIGPNSIVAAGSVVTKDVPPNTVYGGNPAKLICTYEEYVQKLIERNKNYPWKQYLTSQEDEKKFSNEIIQRRVEYYWGNNSI